MRRTQLSSSFLLSLISISLLIFTIEMAESANPSSVHIVYTEKPTDEEPEAYHLRTLSSLLGSDEAAKDALVYSYKTAASGFSAKLTPEQVDRLSREPGVLQVVPSKTYQLHPAKPGGRLR
ncbi:Proteinase inhibitor propeptide [Euphorbia peplus]|nr:Proteinase inhibitor propeptide [Euphorbia peplus]